MYLFYSPFSVYATHLLRVTLNLPFCCLMRTDVTFSQLLDTWNCQNSPCSFNYHPTSRIYSSNLPRRTNSTQDTLFTAIKINLRSPVYFIGMSSCLLAYNKVAEQLIIKIKMQFYEVTSDSRSNTGRPWLKEFTHLHFTSFSSSILGEVLHPP